MKNIAEEEERRIFYVLGRRETGGIPAAQIKTALQNAMMKGAGIFREGATAAEALSEVVKLMGALRQVNINDASRVYNMELREVIELDGMLHAAYAVLLGAYFRTESRGAHYRLDHPRRDDKNWLRHTLVYRIGESYSVVYQPVRVERWPPEARQL